MNQSCMINQTSIQPFLQRLAFDDEYRDRLNANPGSVLAEQGIQYSESIKGIQLPSKAAAQALLNNIASETDSEIEPVPAPPSFLFNLFIFRAPTGKGQQFSNAQ